MSDLIERGDDALYFTVEGERYRVHDACFGGPLAKAGQKKLLRLESPQSNTRYFVTAGGVRRAYAFKKAESRTITEDALLSQLHASGFVGSTPREREARRPN